MDDCPAELLYVFFTWAFFTFLEDCTQVCLHWVNTLNPSFCMGSEQGEGISSCKHKQALKQQTLKFGVFKDPDTDQYRKKLP